MVGHIHFHFHFHFHFHIHIQSIYMLLLLLLLAGCRIEQVGDDAVKIHPSASAGSDKVFHLKALTKEERDGWVTKLIGSGGTAM
jgi:hypothetical protein